MVQQLFISLHKEGLIEIVRYFKNEGVDLNINDNDGNTPVHLASRAGHAEIVKYLRQIDDNDRSDDHKAVPIQHVLNRNGESCLHLAAENGRSDVIACFLDDGIILNKQVTLSTNSFMNDLNFNNELK